MKILALGVASTLALISAASAQEHADLMRQVQTVKPMAAFNMVVGEQRFVGYFVAGPDRCDVTVFRVSADDETLAVKPRRMVLQIAAAGRNELDAGPDAALAIACTADADALKLAPQGRMKAAKL